MRVTPNNGEWTRESRWCMGWAGRGRSRMQHGPARTGRIVCSPITAGIRPAKRIRQTAATRHPGGAPVRARAGTGNGLRPVRSRHPAETSYRTSASSGKGSTREASQTVYRGYSSVAENSGKTAAREHRGRPFRPGEPGNTGGRPKVATDFRAPEEATPCLRFRAGRRL